MLLELIPEPNQLMHMAAPLPLFPCASSPLPAPPPTPPSTFPPSTPPPKASLTSQQEQHVMLLEFIPAAGHVTPHAARVNHHLGKH